jgi:hypothetical protein
MTQQPTPQADIGTVTKSISFLISAVRSGEPWTVECEGVAAAAFQALGRLGAVHGETHSQTEAE